MRISDWSSDVCSSDLQLFAAGYSACFLGAIKFAAGKQKVKVAEASRVTAKVGIGPRDDGEGFGLDVELVVSLPALERDVAQRLVDPAHLVCPYSHPTPHALDVRLSFACPPSGLVAPPAPPRPRTPPNRAL